MRAGGFAGPFRAMPCTSDSLGVQVLAASWWRRSVGQAHVFCPALVRAVADRVSSTFLRPVFAWDGLWMPFCAEIS